MSVVKAPTRPPERLLLNRDPFALVELHKFREFPCVDVVVALLDDHVALPFPESVCEPTGRC